MTTGETGSPWRPTAVPVRAVPDAGAGTRARRDVSDGSRFVRPSLEQIPPGDPIPGLAPGVASLGLNEGLSGPFPSALAAIAAATATLNRYPERGSAKLVAALAARHDVPEAQVSVAAGADALIGYVCQAVLDPGDEVIVPWPSFPSFVRDAQKRDAVPVLVPLDAAGRLDVAAVRAAVTPRTRLLFVATPNNPTGPRGSGGRADRARPRPAGSRPAGARRGVLRLPRSGRPLRRDRGSRSRR